MARLKPTERDELLIRLDERVGDLKDKELPEVKELIRAQNTRIRKNEQRISKIWGVMIGIGVLGGSGVGLGISRLIGG